MVRGKSTGVAPTCALVIRTFENHGAIDST